MRPRPPSHVNKKKTMKLAIMTKPTFFVEENKILEALFEEGLDDLHIYKPNSSPVYIERLLSLLPESTHRRITVHPHRRAPVGLPWQLQPLVQRPQSAERSQEESQVRVFTQHLRQSFRKGRKILLHHRRP